MPENEALGNRWLAWNRCAKGCTCSSGRTRVLAGVRRAPRSSSPRSCAREAARDCSCWCCAAAALAALPLYAYVQGHPFRIRYSVPLVVACAAIAAAGDRHCCLAVFADVAAALRRAAAIVQASPLDRSAPLIAEAQRDAENMRGAPGGDLISPGALRRPVDHDEHGLARPLHARPVRAPDSASSEFLHEGNGELWVFAVLNGPRGHVGWVAIEERAEGGDALLHRKPRTDPARSSMASSEWRKAGRGAVPRCQRPWNQGSVKAVEARAPSSPPQSPAPGPGRLRGLRVALS